MINRVVSGGQTGVDRAALDVALELEIPCGGWCPKGRKAEDGAIPPLYPVTETPSGNYRRRTEMNVRDSDGTLILTVGEPEGGTQLTYNLTLRHDKPCLVVDLALSPNPGDVRAWIERHNIRTLNVAGPRESRNPGIHDTAVGFLRAVLLRYTSGA